MLRLIKGAVEFFNKEFRKHRAIRELESLSDRELSDLGITRGNIRLVVSAAIF